tara:strand:+ start:1052 stop:1804 length:753 start_codon:yes stop_codon:yes gene_type:complete
MNDLFSVENKIVVITGGTRGIGNAIANEFAKRNSIVFILDKLVPKKNKITNISHIKCDITNNTQIHNACKNILKKNKKIHVLINNAGITIPNNTKDDYSLKNWEKTLTVNLTGAFICAQTIGKIMKKQKDGSIINITSINAEVGFPNNPAYVASKGGLKMLTKSLAKDYGKYGIRVNNLGPGYIQTDMTKKSYKNKKTRNAREKQTLLGKWGNVSDLIGPCIFLASDSSKYITGQDIYVDGGWLANGLIE